MSETNPQAPPLQWWWHEFEDSDHYYGPFASRDEAIAAAEADTADREPAETTFYICTARPMELRDDIFDVVHVIDRFMTHNEDAWGEGSSIGQVAAEALKDLEERLNAAFAAWRAKHNPWRAYMLDTASFANCETLQRRTRA